MAYPDIEHPILGLLHYDGQYDWYEGQIHLGQSQASIMLEIDGEDRVETTLNKANDFINQLDKYVDESKDYAVEKLLALKNDTWIDEEESPIVPVLITPFSTRFDLLIYNCGDSIGVAGGIDLHLEV